MVDQNIIISLVVTVNTIIIVMAWSMLMQKNQMPVDGRTVLITGASQGMGLECARLLSSKGANVIIVARDKFKLEKAIEQIAAAALNSKSQRFHVISADLTSSESNDKVLAEATHWNNNTPPDIVWAVAGSASPMLFLDATPDILRSQMDTNYWSAAYLAHATLRAWLANPISPVKDKQGKTPTEEERNRHLVFTSSIAAFISMPGYSPYTPAKAAMRALHDQLTSELNLYNGAFSKMPAPSPPQIKLHTVFPATIDSPGLVQENITKPGVTKLLEEGDGEQSPEDAAKQAVSGLEKGHAFVTVTFLGAIVKSAAWMGSVRDQPVFNTLMAWIINVVWLFASWDMANKVWKWGEKEGLPMHESVETTNEK